MNSRTFAEFDDAVTIRGSERDALRFLTEQVRQRDLEAWLDTKKGSWKPNVLGQVGSWLTDGLADRAFRTADVIEFVSEQMVQVAHVVARAQREGVQ